MARVALVGFETGDLSELSSSGTGLSINSSTVNSTGGAYSIKSAGLATDGYFLDGLNSAHLRFKVYINLDNDTTPPGTWRTELFTPTSSGFANIASCILNQDATGVFTFIIQDSTNTQVGQSAALTFVKNVWYYIEFDVTVGVATGTATVYQNGVSKLVVTNKNFTANNIGVCFFGAQYFTAGRNLYFDDFEADDAVLCGGSYVIARQFKAGTPTYGAWTESSGTIDTVWDDTPFSAASNATSSTLNNAQTALTYALGSVQTGHGNGAIMQGDTVNGAKAALVGKAASGSAASIRRRVGGSDTDTAITFTTSDAFYESAVFTDTLANLDSSEVGVLQGANAVLQTVEDAWLMISYTPVALSMFSTRRMFM